MVAFDKFLQGTPTDSKRQGQTALLPFDYDFRC